MSKKPTPTRPFPTMRMISTVAAPDGKSRLLLSFAVRPVSDSVRALAESSQSWWGDEAETKYFAKRLRELGGRFLH